MGIAGVRRKAAVQYSSAFIMEGLFCLLFSYCVVGRITLYLFESLNNNYYYFGVDILPVVSLILTFLGFHIIRGGESSKDVHEVLYQYLEKAPEAIYYDNACK